ncbi:hypothetical protein [Brevibacillus borstelensis]|uniref:hypothetical protein n=1 Tax=Brevibacillus borstelensis TaxID=45462 RepID=UPI002E1EB119|nr:hypothetical protein [Brevibacillus borstelensis]
MAKHVFQQHPNLVLAEEVMQVILGDALCHEAKSNLFKAFFWLDAFGIDKEYLGKRLCKTSDGWELVAKGVSEWRFKIRETKNTDIPLYEIISFYQKN